MDGLAVNAITGPGYFKSKQLREDKIKAAISSAQDAFVAKKQEFVAKKQELKIALVKKEMKAQFLTSSRMFCCDVYNYVYDKQKLTPGQLSFFDSLSQPAKNKLIELAHYCASVKETSSMIDSLDFNNEDYKKRLSQRINLEGQKADLQIVASFKKQFNAEFEQM